MRDPRDQSSRFDVPTAIVTAVWDRETLAIVDADPPAAARLGLEIGALAGVDLITALEPNDGPLGFVLHATVREQTACTVRRHRPQAACDERVTMTPLASQRWRVEIASVEPSAGMIGARNDAIIDLISHELRSPLNAAMTWASVLEIERTEQTIDRAVAVIKQSIYEQARLIEDLVDVARSERPTFPLDTLPLDLTTQIDRAVSQAQTHHPARTIRSLVPKMTIDGDDAQLHRALRHLIENAVKFAPDDGAVTLRGDRAGAHAIVDVTGAGIGLSHDDLSHVFDSFWRADPNSTGTGLGLGVVRTVVDRHGGVVAARSGGTGRGATFSIALPISA
jgi:signal transduction histidine kinase